MTETKLKNAAEKLPQAESTFYDVLKKAETKGKSVRTGRRVAVLAVSMMLICGVVFAGVAEADFSAWAKRTDDYHEAGNISEEIGISLPDNLADRPFYNFTAMYVVPDGTRYLEALTTSVYRWYSADFGTEIIEYDESGKGYSPVLTDKITISFGDTENELWKYVFGANDDGKWSTDDYEYVATYEYKGIALQVSEKTLYSADGEVCADYDYRVKWVDYRNNAAFVLHVDGSSEESASVAVDVAKEIINAN